MVSECDDCLVEQEDVADFPDERPPSVTPIPTRKPVFMVPMPFVNAAVNFPKSAEVKFPNYADGVVMERWLFFGGRPLGFGGGVKAGGVISAFERTCSGMSSAC